LIEEDDHAPAFHAVSTAERPNPIPDRAHATHDAGQDRRCASRLIRPLLTGL